MEENTQRDSSRKWQKNEVRHCHRREIQEKIKKDFATH